MEEYFQITDYVEHIYSYYSCPMMRRSLLFVFGEAVVFGFVPALVLATRSLLSARVSCCRTLLTSHLFCREKGSEGGLAAAFFP